MFTLTEHEAYRIVQELNETLFEGEIPTEMIRLELNDVYMPTAFYDEEFDIICVDLLATYYADNVNNARDAIARQMVFAILIYNGEGDEMVNTDELGNITHPLFEHYAVRAWNEYRIILEE